MAANASFSSADSYVAHVNDEPRVQPDKDDSTVLDILSKDSTPTKQRLADVFSGKQAYPTEADNAADSRASAAAPPMSTEQPASAAHVATPVRPPSVPRDRRNSATGDFGRSNSASSYNSKLYFHSPPQSNAVTDCATATAPAAAPATRNTQPPSAGAARTDVKPLSQGAVCTPTTSEDSAAPEAGKPVHSHTKPTSSTTPVKPAARTPTRPMPRREDVKEESLSLPFTSNQAYDSGPAVPPRQNPGALARRSSREDTLSRSSGRVSQQQQQRSPQKLVARMSLSQSNAGAMVPYVDKSDERSNTAYNREYDLTMVEHKAPSRRVSVQRYVPTARPSEWNSNLKEKNTAPLELLPRISLSSQAPHYARASSASGGRRQRDLANGNSVGDGQRVHSLPVSSYPTPSSGASQGATQDAQSANGRQLFAQRYNENNAVQAYRDELGDALDRIDFKRAMTQLNTGNVGGDDYQAALAFFSLVAKDKLTFFPEDLHELLVLFTPPGVALREAEDFLWEECEQKTRLSFSEFLLYGPRLRDRVFDYEQFEELNDIQRLLVTYARVFPGRPSEDRDYARIRLLAAGRDQLGERLPDKFRPLRIYEYLFLVAYQEMLYRAGVIHSAEVPPMVHGDLPSDVQAAARERRRHSSTAAPGGGKEDIEWGGPGDATAAPAAPANQAATRQIMSAPQERTKDRRDEYPSLARCNTKGKKGGDSAASRNGTTAQGSRKGHRGRRTGSAANDRTSQLMPGCISSRSRGGSAYRRSRVGTSGQRRQPFEVRTVRDTTLDKTSRDATARYMGPTPASTRRDQAREDDSLIQRLQLCYDVQS